MEKHHIYCFSGLGADFRIFSNLQIDNAVLHPIDWHVPEVGETLPAFAARLSAQVTHPAPVLLGVSFGGMLSTEISQQMAVKKTIIVSSAKSRLELPAYMRAAGKVGLHKIVPYWLVTRSTALNRFIFDASSRAEELYLKQMMLKQSDARFIKRSVDMILNWKRKDAPADIVHIHGRRDKLLLPQPVKAAHWIQDGGHFMVWNKAAEVSRIINTVLGAMDQRRPIG